jgi:hypothetical protein
LQDRGSKRATFSTVIISDDAQPPGSKKRPKEHQDRQDDWQAGQSIDVPCRCMAAPAACLPGKLANSIFLRTYFAAGGGRDQKRVLNPEHQSISRTNAFPESIPGR